MEDCRGDMLKKVRYIYYAKKALCTYHLTHDQQEILHGEHVVEGLRTLREAFDWGIVIELADAKGFFSNYYFSNKNIEDPNDAALRRAEIGKFLNAAERTITRYWQPRDETCEKCLQNLRDTKAMYENPEFEMGSMVDDLEI